MPSISGTVSRDVPVDKVIGRALTLSGTFSVYVAAHELAKLGPTIDQLIASGILTAYLPSDSDAAVSAFSAPAVDAVAAGTAVIYPTQAIPIAHANHATETLSYTMPRKVEIINVEVRKSGTDTGGTVQVKDGSNAAITDAIVAAVDKALTRATTIDPAKNQIAAGANVNITYTRGSGASDSEVFLHVIYR